MVRRNQITEFDSWIVAAVAVLSAAAALFSGVEPTGDEVADVILVSACAALVTWAGASAPWWALVCGSGIVTAIAIAGPGLWLVVGLVAVGLSGWIGWQRRNLPVARAVVSALVVQVALRFEWNPFFLASAIVAAVAIGVILVSGVVRRRRVVRRRVIYGAIGTGILALLAGVGLGVSGAGAAEPAREGYNALLEGLDLLQSGDTIEASQALWTAATELESASERLDSSWTQPSRFVPAVSQNRRAAANALSDAAEASASAAAVLQVVDLDSLTVVDGRVDIESLAELSVPLTELRDTVYDLRETLYDADSPWLVSPFASRLDEAIDRADQVATQANATAAGARIGPTMLGADGPRVYLLAFVNSAEARGQGGLMGNWVEVTIDDGEFAVTNSGRSADLQAESLRDLELDMSAEYMERYGRYGASVDGGVLPKFWSNVTMPADMPTVGSSMAQMYETATGQSLDGVFVIDAAGLAALLEVSGSIEIEDIDREFSGDDLEDFLLLEQYEFEEAEREDILEAITAQTIENVLGSTLPSAQEIAATLAPAVLNGHISGWAQRSTEEDLFRLIGMDGALPVLAPGTDGLAVVSINASGNKIENFLERTIEYRPSVDQRTGRVTATASISLTNTAPTRGFNDYVIGNIIDEPVGTNRMLLDVYTPLTVERAVVDGKSIDPFTQPELGYNVLRLFVDIPAGETASIDIELSGDVGAGPYRLVYRPQALPRPDSVIIEATTDDGAGIFSFEGELERRTAFSAQGQTAWR